MVLFPTKPLVSVHLDARWSTTWLQQLQSDQKIFLSFGINQRASKPVISSDDNTCCISAHVMDHSPVFYRFIPDTDSVYLAEAWVPLHDYVVTERISVWVTLDIQCLLCMWGGLQIISFTSAWPGRACCFYSYQVQTCSFTPCHLTRSFMQLNSTNTYKIDWLQARTHYMIYDCRG